MRKISCWVLVLIILCFHASMLLGDNMVTGVTVGYNTSNHIPLQNTHTTMPGFRIGGLAQIPLGKSLFQAELCLASKGFLAESIGDTRLSNLFLYLELPLSIKYELLPSDMWNIYLLGGLSARWKVIAINLVSELEGIRMFDVGAHTGLGLRYKKIALEVRYDQGLINFDLIEPAKFHQTLSLGMNFYFGGK